MRVFMIYKQYCKNIKEGINFSVGYIRKPHCRGGVELVYLFFKQFTKG